MKSLAQFLPLGFVILGGCATDRSHLTRMREGDDRMGSARYRGVALPIKVPSVQFSPGSIVTKGDVEVAAGSVPEGSYVSVRVFVAPRTKPEDVLDLHLLHHVQPGDSPCVFASPWQKVEDSSKPIQWTLNVQTPIPVETNAAYSVIGVYVGTGTSTADVTVKNVGYDTRTFLLLGVAQIEVSRIRAEFDVPREPPSGHGSSSVMAANPNPVPPRVVPSVIFLAGSRATLQGTLQATPADVPEWSFLHLAAYQGQSMSAEVQPISFQSIGKNTVRSTGQLVRPADCELDMSGPEFELMEGMTHLWMLFVTEVWHTPTGADPRVNSRVGTVVVYDIPRRSAFDPIPLYFVK